MRARLRDRGGAATHLRFHFEPFSCPPPSLRRKPWRGWKVSKDTGTDTGVYDIRIRGWVAGVFGREGEAVVEVVAARTGPRNSYHAGAVEDLELKELAYP